jgi:uncharacterized protein YbbC (DUF1343 family)
MKGWNRQMRWNDTKLEWVTPSPNLRTAEAALIYPATCYIEATNVSVGRGTDDPFLTIGAPFIDGNRLARGLAGDRIPGLEFSPTVFTPGSSKWKGVRCEGVKLRVADPAAFRPVEAGVRILWTLQRLYADSLKVQKRSFERLFGTGGVYEALFGSPVPLGEPEQAIREREIEKELRSSRGLTDEFASRSRNYWIYDGN